MVKYQKKIMFSGFLGFKSISHLRKYNEEIPEEQGVYLIIYDKKSIPTFLSKRPRDNYGRRCPATPKDELKKK